MAHARFAVGLNRASLTPPPQDVKIKGYWIVLADERSLEVYRRPEAGTYREQASFSLNDIVQCAAVPEVRVALREILA